MHKSATLQNGLARMIAGVSKALKPTKWFVAIAALFVVALLAVLVPAVVFADAPAVPGWPDEGAVTSGDGTMTLNWDRADRATGYQFRYADNATVFFSDPESLTWHVASSSGTDTDVTIPTDTSPGVPALTVGTTYFFEVRAVNNESTPTDTSDDTYSGPSSTNNGLQRVAPAKLAGVTAAAGNAEVTLSWDNPNDDTITSYDYRQSDDGGSNWGGWQNFTISPDTYSYTVSSLSNGTTYSFQVRANNNQGSGPDSETVNATPYGRPAAPDLRATPGDSEVRLYWTDLVDTTITKFQYRTRITSEGAEAWDPNWDDISGSSATTTEHTVEDLTNTNEYTFEVRAINDQGNGAKASVTATPTTAETVPSEMSNVEHVVTGVNNGKGGTVTLTWDNPSNGQIDKYQYRYDATSNNPPICDVNRNPSGCGWDVDWTNIPGTNNDKNLTSWGPVNIHGSGSVTFYQLRAVNNDADDSGTTDVNEGAGPETAIRVVRANTPVETTDPPGAPRDLTATATPGVAATTGVAAVPAKVTLSWTASAEATQGYQVRQSTDGGANFDAWAEKFGEATTDAHTVTDLTDGTTYTFELRMVAGTADAPVYGAAARARPIPGPGP